MDNLVVTSLVLGLMLGLTHALDPDHLVAVGTLAAESKSFWQSSILGGIWGIGHTTALAVIGGGVLSLKWTIPDGLATGMEAIVGIMIVFLGVQLLWRSTQKITVHVHDHSHDGSIHSHLHLHGKETTEHQHHSINTWTKAFGVGVVHGMAGSAALTLAVMATMPTVFWGLVYIVIFGLGSIGSMVLMSMLLSMPFVLGPRWWGAWEDKVKIGTGLLAVGFGGYFTWGLLS